MEWTFSWPLSCTGTIKHMIKAVIFDCFGVLTTEAFHAFRDKYFLDSPEDRIRANKLMEELNKAKIPYDDFLKRLADLSKISKQDALEYLSTNQPNEPLFDFIRRDLKAKYKISILSNAGGNWIKEIFSKKDVELFDDIVLSYEHGITKPSADIFLLAAQRLNLDPRECVFIDDNASHCEGAEAVGMKAVKYEDFPQLKKDLEKVLSAGADN
jgi:epoxide hydrolase-like predicted phosphatase